MFGKKSEPEMADIYAQQDRRPSAIDVRGTKGKATSDNKGLTGASALTLKQSILPISLVTILFFLWGFAYGKKCATVSR